MVWEDGGSNPASYPIGTQGASTRLRCALVGCDCPFFYSNGFDPGAVVWVAPDGVVGIPTDILSMIAGFGNQRGSPTKTRADVEPCVLDFKINIIDIVRALDAFRGLPFPFQPGVLDCPASPCG